MSLPPAEHWFHAARDPRVLADLADLFRWVDAHVAARGPACWASGRCCNFDRAGHLLYTTALEAAFTLLNARPRAEAAGSPTSIPLPQLAAARAAPACPFQVANLCSVHAVRPVGCRVYFCDRAAQDWQRELSEQAQARLRALHDRIGVTYLYAEWRTLLESLHRAG